MAVRPYTADHLFRVMPWPCWRRSSIR